jgi:WD40 repeat protein
VITAGNDSKMHVWSIDEITPSELAFERSPVGVVEGHENAVTCVAFSRDGTKMFSADTNGNIKIWMFHAYDDGSLHLNLDCIATLSVDSAKVTKL